MSSNRTQDGRDACPSKPPRWRLPIRVRFGTGCGTRTRGVVSVIKSDVQSPLCQASVEMVPPTRAARV